MRSTIKWIPIIVAGVIVVIFGLLQSKFNFLNPSEDPSKKENPLEPLSWTDKNQNFLQQNKDKEGVTVTASGLQYKVLQEGTGTQPANSSATVEVHYRGTLIDGTEFDSSYKRDQTAQFPLNQVIPGWTEGLQLMKEGGKYEFYIPQSLGYGGQQTGSIPAFSTLIFQVELIKVL